MKRKIKKLNINESNKMSRYYIIFIGILFIIFLVRFTSLMVFKTANGQDLSALVQELYNRNEVIMAKRGNIYDSSGEIIATDVKTYDVYAVLTNKYEGVTPVSDKLAAAKKLASHLEMKEDDILKLLNQTSVNQTSFGTAGSGLSYDTKTAIENEQIPGIYFTEKTSREYPKGYFANNIVGLAQDQREDTSQTTDQNPLVGTMGLELQYNAQLAGIDGLVSYEKDFYGVPIQGTEQVIEAVKNGNNIYTTLDSTLQSYLEQLASEEFEAEKPKNLNVMVVRPKTGDVVAVTQRPTFNPSTQSYPTDGWVNQLVETSVEPGSTMKVLALAAGVNEGKFSPMDLFQSGSIKVGNITINDWNTKGWGTITYLDGLARSSNVAFVDLVSRIGYDKWKQYLDAFGFGKSTQSGFANESAGTNNYSTDEVKASTAFGQGISVTNLQMMQAFTAIANEGKMMKLRFVDRIETADSKEVTYIPTEVVGQPILSDTAKKVLDYLQQSTTLTSSLTTAYRISGVNVAAKTGTAQIFDEATQKYGLSTDADYLTSLVAMVPSEDPQYVIYLTSTAKNSNAIRNIYQKFMPFALKYINQLPNSSTSSSSSSSSTSSSTRSSSQASDELSTATVLVPDAVNATKDQTTTAFKNSGFTNLYFFGTGDSVQKQLPLDNQSYPTDSKMMFYTGGEVTMPDMTGWSRQEVARFASLLNISVTYKGQGFVSAQSLAAKTVFNPAPASLEVTLSQGSVRTATSQGTSQSTTSTRR